MVYRNDALTGEQVLALKPTAAVLSPGPCTPAEAGILVPLVRALAGKVPTLGVCLGHQAIGAAFEGRVVRADRVMHGKRKPTSITARRARPVAACSPTAPDRGCSRTTGRARSTRGRRDSGDKRRPGVRASERRLLGAGARAGGVRYGVVGGPGGAPELDPSSGPTEYTIAPSAAAPAPNSRTVFPAAIRRSWSSAIWLRRTVIVVPSPG